MNFLAHLLLSGDNEYVILGNYVGDFVKGKLTDDKVANWIPEYTTGIRLHRFIDNFTDTHEEVRKVKHQVALIHGRVAGVAVDVFFDYLLAINFYRYTSESLHSFCMRMNEVIERNRRLVPQEMRPMADAMIANRWLESYGTLSGIEKSLTGLSKRYSFMSPIAGAEKDLMANFEFYQSCFLKFFPQLMESTSEFLKDKADSQY